MTTFILIIVIYEFSTSTIQMNEFSSRETCEFAKTLVLKDGGRDVRAAECVPK